jgi:pimeloyl-ACP methyl ester carboxylesterase
MEAYLEPKVQAFIRYFDFPGVEPTVVFLAGLGLASTAAYPRIVVEAGLSDRHSILVDLFGCGYSDRPVHFSYSLEDHAATLSGLLDHIGSSQYALVGHIMGGAVAIELASKRTDLISQLILAEANLEAGGGIFSTNIAAQTENDFISVGYQELLENRRSAAINGDSVASIALGVWQVNSPLAFHRSAVSLVRGTEPIMWENLIRLSIPRTFIFGGRSLEEYEEDRETYKKLEAHGIQVFTVPDAGHGMMVDNPVGFADAINQALLLVGH